MDIRERMINPRISQQQVLPTLISEMPKVRFRQDKDPADVLVLSLLRVPNIRPAGARRGMSAYLKRLSCSG